MDQLTKSNDIHKQIFFSFWGLLLMNGMTKFSTCRVPAHRAQGAMISSSLMSNGSGRPADPVVGRQRCCGSDSHRCRPRATTAHNCAAIDADAKP